MLRRNLLSPAGRHLCVAALCLIVAPSVAALESDGDQQGAAHAMGLGAVSPETPRVDDRTLTDRNRLLKPPDRSPPSRDQIEAMIRRLASLHRLDINLVHAVVRAESGYNVDAVSSAGAVGLMQVMPATASDYGVDAVDALFDPSTNLDTGMRHLKRLLGKYGSIGQAVMAYNAGEGALARGGGFVSYPETQRYTHTVVVSYLRKIGIQPYTPKAREVIGIDVTPAMAKASGRGAAGSRSDSVSDRDDLISDEHVQNGPLTRLTSRLSPGLSRRAKGDDASSFSSAKPNSVLDRNRPRFARDGLDREPGR